MILTTDSLRGNLDLLEILGIDPRACEGRNLRLLRVHSGGDAVLYVRVNGKRANATGALVKRHPRYARADWLYMPQGQLEIGPDVESLELEVLPTDHSKPELRIYKIEIVENW